MKAPIRMRCMCCAPQGQLNGNIAEGDEYFFIEGYRTYLKYYFDDVGFGKKLGHYIPRNLQNPSNRRRVDAFRDPIFKHRVCANCMKKITKFLCLTTNPEHMKLDARYTFSTDFMMRIIGKSQMAYRCDCCGVVMPKESSYCRRGYYGTICFDCLDVAEGVVGKEYSN